MHKKHHEEKIHEKKGKHVGKAHFKKGGAVKKHEAEEEEGDVPMKKGGKVAHKAHGHKPKHRMDKFARGGKTVTPKSPESGAAPTEMRPGFGKNKLDKEDD